MDRLEAAILLLVVIDTLDCLRDGAEARHIAEVVRCEDTVVAGPLRRARRLLVDEDNRGNLNGHLAPPVGRVRPLNGVLHNR